MKTRTPVEIDTRYSTTVDTMADAWAFVMEHIDQMGDEPSVHINPCWGVDRDDAVNEPEGQCHFHVSVEGSTEMTNEEKDEMTNDAVKRPLKWVVPVDDQPHEIGSGRVLHVECQGGPEVVMVWTEEVGTKPAQNRTVQVYGTGHEVPMFAEHVGSYVFKGGSFGGSLVWHVYELPPVVGPIVGSGSGGAMKRDGRNGDPIRETWP